MYGSGSFYANLSPYIYPFKILTNPVDGYNELKNNNKYSLKMANYILLTWFIVSILLKGYTDFDFNFDVVSADSVNIPLIFLTTIVIFALGVISNWCFSTLMDGKGKLINIWITLSYALLPVIITSFIKVILSHTLVMEEAVFVNYIIVIGQIWTVVLMFLALQVLHDYTIVKTVASVFLTLCGIAIILFLIILMSGVYTQLYNFVMTVFSEISMRLK